MSNRNPLSKNERRLLDLVKAYEAKQGEREHTELEPEDYADIVDWYDANYKLDDGDHAMDEALSFYPDNTSLIVQEANRMISDGQVEQAEKISKSVEDDASEDLVLLRARLLLMHGEEAKAKKLLKKFGEDMLDPVLVACMYLDAGRPDLARPWLKNEDDDIVKDEFYYSTLANYEFTSKHYDKALEIFDQLLDQDPFSSFYWLCEAKCHFMTEQYSKGIDACNFALLNDSEYGEAYILRAVMYQLLGNSHQAEDDYRRGQSTSQDVAPAVNEYVINALAGKRKWAEIEQLLELELKCGSLTADEKAVDFARLGLCLSYMGDHSQAAIMFQQAYTLNPYDTEAMLYEGHEHMYCGDMKQAKACWKMASCTVGGLLEDWEIELRIGSFLFDDGHMKDAFKHLEKAKTYKPDLKYINSILLSVALLLKDKRQIKKYNRLCADMMSDSYIDEAIEMLNNGDHGFVKFLVNKVDEGIDKSIAEGRMLDYL